MINTALIKKDLKAIWREVFGLICYAVGVCSVAAFFLAIAWVYFTYPMQAIPLTVGIILGKVLVLLWRRYCA